MLDIFPPVAPITDTPSVPHSREAEEAVIGSVFINPEIFPELRGIISADDFYIFRNKWIWDGFESLWQNKTPTDILTVAEELERKSQLKEVGGRAYLTSLVNQVPSSLNADSYAEIVASYSTRRQAIQAANDIAKAAYDDSLSVEQVVQTISKSDLQIQQRAFRDNMKDARQLASASFDRLAEIAESGHTPGLKIGIPDLDFVIGGLRNSEYIIVAGRPGTGKTAFMLKVLRTACKAGKYVSMFSLEMSSMAIVNRIISAEAQINSEAIRDGTMTEAEYDRYTNCLGIIEDWNCFVDDTPAATPDEILAKCTRMKAQGKLDLVLIDYVGIMGIPSWVQRYNNRVQEVSYLSRELKRITKTLNVPVVVGAQVGREVEKRSDTRLVMADLKESGSLEQDSDVIILLQLNKDEEIKSELTPRRMTVAKNRNGAISRGDIETVFQGKFTDFYGVKR